MYGLGAGVWTRDMAKAYRRGRIGEVGGVPFYLDAGESDTFSLENVDQAHFVARSSACLSTTDLPAQAS